MTRHAWVPPVIKDAVVGVWDAADALLVETARRNAGDAVAADEAGATARSDAMRALAGGEALARS